MAQLLDRARLELSHPLARQAGPPVVAPDGAAGGALEDVERQHIITVLTQTQWRIEGAKGAAGILNLEPSTLRSRMKKLRIVRPSA